MFFQKKGVGFQPAPFAETREKIKNPGRGFYEIHTFVLGQEWDLENLRWCIRQEHTLALVILDIRAARERELTAEELSDIDAMLGAFGSLGTDVLFRPVYDREGRGMQNEPALLSRVREHMRQLAPVIQAHREHILLLQGLLVGSWGEMHASKFLQPASIRQLAEVWLQETDQNIAVRTPAFHRILSGYGAEGRAAGRSPGQSAGQITGRFAGQIAGQSARQIALYNDGLFGSETDLGTYEDREGDLAYLQDKCRHSINGGEAVWGKDLPGADEVVDRMKRLHIAYLNHAHDVRMLEHFRKLTYKKQNLYDYIEDHMGYRFVIRRAAKSLRPGGGLRLEIQVENTGFGNLCQEADISLILEGQDGQRRELPLTVDPRRWEAGETSVISVDIDDPATATVYLSLRRRLDARVLQFANQGQKEGMAVLGTLTVRQAPQW